MRIADPPSLALNALLALIVGGAVGFIAAQALGGLGWLAGGAVAAGTAAFTLRGPLRRWRVARQAFPARWQRWLARRVPFYASLEESGRRRFERDVQFFLEEHAFEGVEDTEVTDELRLSVAAGAALLLNGRPGWELRGAGRSVLFYPDRFDEAYHGGDYAAFDGMAHEQGPILLSAKAVRESWADATDGSNVVLHELAHLFDFQNQGADGVPSLMASSSEGAWRDLVRRETQRIRRRRSMLRRYAATAPSEFFAVAVEAFFERPAEMRRRHAELYEALCAFFNLDPAAKGAREDEQQARGQGERLRGAVKTTGPDVTHPPAV